MPTVMLNVRGMRIRASSAGNPSSTSAKSMSRIWVTIR
jgi:hypothetical protein